MSRTIKTSNKIIFDNPEIDFVTTLIKLNTSPVVNNANINYLTRNSVSGNLELVNSLPTIYNANGTLTGNRTVSAGFSNNLTFTGGIGTFSITSWQIINLNGETITCTSSTSSTFNSVNLLNLGTTTPTTTISALTRTLNLNATTTNINNIAFKPAGYSSGQYIFIDSLTKTIRCENLPIAYGNAQIVGVLGGPILTNTSPVDISGANVNINVFDAYNFTSTPGDGVLYNITQDSTTFPVTKFSIEISGYYTATVAQDYIASILINGSSHLGSISEFTYTGSGIAQFATRKIITSLSNGDEIKLGLGRSTSDANFNMNVNITVLPVSYY